MTNAVTIPAIITGTVPRTYTDDNDPITGLAGGMHTVNLVPLYADSVLVAMYAKAQADEANATAATVVQSPYTQATSSSSLTVGTGSRSFTLNELNKSFAVGQTVNVTNGAGVNIMTGVITAFTPATGAITVNATQTIGSGTFSAWIVSLGAQGGGVSNALATTGASVQVNTATPPTAGQLLTATTPTAAAWVDAPRTTPDYLLINAGII